MEPDTGNILAMCNYPDYNLNTPFTPIDPTVLETWTTLNSQERNDYLYKMWNNNAVQNTYEPGSTFKIITAATALEENIVGANATNVFNCTGYETVNGINIFCWRSRKTSWSTIFKTSFSKFLQSFFHTIRTKSWCPYSI